MKLFISYSEMDKGVVEIMEHQLRTVGIVVWRDKEFLKAGDEWQKNITEQIKGCDGFFLVVSKNSIQSPNVTGEVIKALEYNKIIYPFTLDASLKFPVLTNLHHQKYESSFFVDDIIKIFKINIKALDYDAFDMVDAVNRYKADIKKNNDCFSVLMQRGTIPIENVYIDCCLQCGIEYNRDNFNERFLSCDLIDSFNGGLFIITGHPGTGKTSLLNYFTYRLSEEKRDFLPISVHLKNYDPNYISFEDFIESNTGNLVTRFGLSSLTKKFNCILFIDGLDESIPKAYENVKREINKIIMKHPKLTVVVTTRINGFKNIREADYPTAEFYTIAPLDETIIRKYLEKWFSQKDKAMIEVLYNVIIQNDRILELAKQAIFMLCLMCIVYEAENQLTTNVSSLYSKAIKHLLGTRGGVFDDERNLRIEVLKNLALRFLEMQQRNFESYLTEGIVQSIIENKTTKPAKEFLKDIIEDTGLLQCYEGRYSFIHLSFQEFFVAQATVEGKYFNESNLLDYSNISMWEETFKLYAGLLENEKRKEKYLTLLSEKNLSLALRVATNCGHIGTKVLKDIIVHTSTNDKLRMIEEIKDSLTMLRPDVAQKLVVQTLKPLISLEVDSTVLYYSIQLLKQYDPADKYKIMYENFYQYQEEKLTTISSNIEYLFELVSIPSGSFIMGDDHSIDYNEKPEHRVYLDGFSISRYQLTNKAFEYIMNLDSSRRHPQYSSEDNQPVINVDWFDAYICALRVGCRLPTEAEWEYAARATTTTKWCFGDDEMEIIQYAHCYESKAEKTRDADQGIPNKWGLYNVHGNVWEWCSDWFDKYSAIEQQNPTGPEHGTLRVRRGGGWLYHARGCKSSFRYGNEPNYKYNDIGIRLAM